MLLRVYWFVVAYLSFKRDANDSSISIYVLLSTVYLRTLDNVLSLTLGLVL